MTGASVFEFLFVQAEGLPHFSFEAVAAYSFFMFAFGNAEGGFQVKSMGGGIAQAPKDPERIDVLGVALGDQKAYAFAAVQAFLLWEFAHGLHVENSPGEIKKKVTAMGNLLNLSGPIAFHLHY